MPPSKSCCTCQRCFCILFALIVLGAVTGVLIWQFVPGASNKVDDLIPTPAPVDDMPAYQYNQCDDDNTEDCCNGLSEEGMCDLRVDEILWAMSHNSAATRDDGMLLFPNHRLNLAQSLPAGIRGINLDVCNCAGELKLCHGLCSVGTVAMVPVFTTLITFLNENPTELLLVTLELNSDVDQPVDVNAVQALLAGSVSGFTDQLYVHENIQDEWPTLRTLKELNQRMILFHYNGENCDDSSCPVGFHHWFSSAVETPFAFSTPEEIQDTANSCILDRGQFGQKAFFGVNAFTTLPDRNEAEIVNEFSFLDAHLNECSALNQGLDVNVVSVDFWSEGDVVEVVQERNKDRAAAAVQRRAARLLTGKDIEKRPLANMLQT